MADDCDRIWLNTHEFLERTKNLSPEQVGSLFMEILELARAGKMKNGPAVRVDPPDDEEATDGTNS